MAENVKLDTALEQNDYLGVNDYINKSINHLKISFRKSDLASLAALEDEIERQKARCSFLVKKALTQQNIYFIFGRYIGFIDSIYEQLAEMNREISFRENLESRDISDIPHVNDIIITICQNEGIRHGKLAEEVGIEKSTLSGIMDKLIEKGAIRFSRPGKYKYYFLTDFGKQYYKNNRMIIETGRNLDALTEQLLIALSKEEDANGKLLQVLTALCAGKSKFKEYESKTRKKLDPSIIFAGIPTIKQLDVMFPNTSIHTVNDAIVLKINPEKPIISLYDRNNDLIPHSKFSEDLIKV